MNQVILHNFTDKWKSWKQSTLRKVSAFVGFIGKGFINQRDVKHYEVVNLYKWQILKLELELDEIKHERDEFKKLFFDQLGINQDRTAVNEDKQVIHRPMGPLRMRQSLQNLSRAAVKDKK
jgi:hypothetical protein